MTKVKNGEFMEKEEILKKKVAIITLGCDKNTVDSERIAYRIKNSGFEITTDISNAQIAIINTCAFIESSRKESIDVILETAQHKNSTGLEKLIVCGCLPQRGYKDLTESLPEVDLFVKIKDYPQMAKLIFELYGSTLEDKIEISQPARLISTPNHYAYLKIADGCNNFCSYCTIPFIRGRYNSTPLDCLVNEAKALAEDGVKELILVAQDVTQYGQDLKPKTDIVTLIRELSKIDKIKWIRLLYCYPNYITNELLVEIDTNPKVCKYIDIPFQHTSSAVLKAMNRPENHEKIFDLVDKIKHLERYVSIRSTFMAGFPTETRKDYKILKKSLKQLLLQNVGFFAYSQEEGTRAGSMARQVPIRKRNKRVKSLQHIQTKILKKRQKSMIGKELEVLVDAKYDEDTYIARSEYDAPNVDTVVFIFTNADLQTGEFYKVKVVDTLNDTDLIANLIKE